MTEVQGLIPTIYEGWHVYHEVMTSAIGPLNSEQLAVRAAPNLRSVREIAALSFGDRRAFGGSIILGGAHQVNPWEWYARAEGGICPRGAATL